MVWFTCSSRLLWYFICQPIITAYSADTSLTNCSYSVWCSVTRLFLTLPPAPVRLNTSPAAPASPAPLSTSPDGDVCKYYIGPSVVCLSVLSSAAAVATQWRADRRRRVYDCPTAARSRQVSRHVVLLDAQSAGPSTDRWSHSHAIEVMRHCYIINGRWCRQWRRWGRCGQWCI